MGNRWRRFLFTAALLALADYRSELWAEPELEFPVRFVLLSGKPEVAARATRQQLVKEVDIMNRYFVTEDRRAIVRFSFDSVQPYEAIQDSPCDVVARANRPEQTRDFIFEVVRCADPRVFDPSKLNVYIIDTYDQKKGYREEDSYGGGSGNRRFAALDYERLGHIFAAEEHELGHAFSLGHVCHPGANSRTKTNIMTQRNACPGAVGHEGDRSIGFNRDQERQILAKARNVLTFMKAQTGQSGGVRNPGFENTKHFAWSRRAYTSNHRSGRRALFVDKGKEIYQDVYVAEAGRHSVRFFYNSHGIGGFAAVDVNQREAARSSLPATGGYGKPFTEQEMVVVTTGPAILRLRFNGGSTKVWIDDVSLEKQ